MTRQPPRSPSFPTPPLFQSRKTQQPRRRLLVFHNRHAIILRKPVQQCDGRLEMAAFQKINGRASFDEKENLRRFLNRCKASQRLLDSIVEYAKVFAAQSFHIVAAVIGDDYSTVDAVNADVNRLLWLLRVFLRGGKRTRVQHGRKEQRRRQTAKKSHRSVIR